MDSIPSEMRSHARAQAENETFVHYSFNDSTGHLHEFTGPLEDYCFTGLKLTAFEPLNVGQSLALKIHVANIEGVLRLNGEVRWCLEVNQVPTYHAGILFSLHNSPDITTWRAHCERH